MKAIKKLFLFLTVFALLTSGIAVTAPAFAEDDDDHDDDGNPDNEDECPNQPETYNGFEDSDGCPDTKPGSDSGTDGYTFYQNDEYGFSIEYPTSWIIESEVIVYDHDGGNVESIALLTISPKGDSNYYGTFLEIFLYPYGDFELSPDDIGEQYISNLVQLLDHYCEEDDANCSDYNIVDAFWDEKDGEHYYIIMDSKKFPSEKSGPIVEYFQITIDRQTANGDTFSFWLSTTEDDVKLYQDELQHLLTSFSVERFPAAEPMTEKAIEYLGYYVADSQSFPYLEPRIELSINLEPITESSPSPESTTESSGGCLIATATFGSELAPQVQMLREIRDNSLMQTDSGTTFMSGFNQFYYSFSPTIADWERQNPAFKEAVKLVITPLIASLSILNYVRSGSGVCVTV